MGERRIGRMEGWVNGKVSGWIYGRIDGPPDRRLDVRMCGWADGCLGG
jgi:hypothetical protein